MSDCSVVHGDLDADTVIGDYNDHACSVGGPLRCRLLITGEHHFDVGRVEVTMALGGARVRYEEGELHSADGDRRARARREGGERRALERKREDATRVQLEDRAA